MAVDIGAYQHLSNDPFASGSISLPATAPSSGAGFDFSVNNSHNFTADPTAAVSGTAHYDNVTNTLTWISGDIFSAFNLTTQLNVGGHLGHPTALTSSTVIGISHLTSLATGDYSWTGFVPGVVPVIVTDYVYPSGTQFPFNGVSGLILSGIPSAASRFTVGQSVRLDITYRGGFGPGSWITSGTTYGITNNEYNPLLNSPSDSAHSPAAPSGLYVVASVSGSSITVTIPKPTYQYWQDDPMGTGSWNVACPYGDSSHPTQLYPGDGSASYGQPMSVRDDYPGYVSNNEYSTLIQSQAGPTSMDGAGGATYPPFYGGSPEVASSQSDTINHLYSSWGGHNWGTIYSTSHIFPSHPVSVRYGAGINNLTYATAAAGGSDPLIFIEDDGVGSPSVPASTCAGSGLYTKNLYGSGSPSLGLVSTSDSQTFDSTGITATQSPLSHIYSAGPSYTGLNSLKFSGIANALFKFHLGQIINFNFSYANSNFHSLLAANPNSDWAAPNGNVAFAVTAVDATSVTISPTTTFAGTVSRDAGSAWFAGNVAADYASNPGDYFAAPNYAGGQGYFRYTASKSTYSVHCDINSGPWLNIAIALPADITQAGGYYDFTSDNCGGFSNSVLYLAAYSGVSDIFAGVGSGGAGPAVVASFSYLVPFATVLASGMGRVLGYRGGGLVMQNIKAVGSGQRLVWELASSITLPHLMMTGHGGAPDDGIGNPLVRITGSGTGVRGVVGIGAAVSLPQPLIEGVGHGTDRHYGTGSIPLPLIYDTYNRPSWTGPTPWVFFSVGSDHLSNLMTGSPSVSIKKGIATFSEPQVGNIGAGDKIVFGSGFVLLSHKINSTTWAVIDPSGIPSSDSVSTPIIKICRCFDSVNSAVGSTDSSGTTCKPTGIVSAQYLGTRNIIAAGVAVVIMCYHNGSGYDEDGAVIIPGSTASGFVTDTYHDISVSAPGLNGDVIYDYYSQRANQINNNLGRPGTGYQICADSATAAVIEFRDCCGKINGIEICGDAVYGVRFNGVDATQHDDANCRVKCCFVHNSGVNALYGIMFDHTYASGANRSAWSNIVYGPATALIRTVMTIHTISISGNTLDRGGPSSATAGFKSDDVSGFLEWIMGLNVFIGGNSGNDVVTSITPPWYYQPAFNLGQSPMFASNLSTWTNLQWLPNLGIDPAANDYDSVFINRSGHDYNLCLGSPILNRAWTNAYAPTDPYPGAGVGGEVFANDLVGNPVYGPPRSIGAISPTMYFEFDGSSIKSVTENRLSYYDLTQKETQDNGEFISDAYDTLYRTASFMIVNQNPDFMSEVNYFAQEEKVLMRLHPTARGDVSGRRRVELVATLSALFEIRSNTLVINKPPRSYNQLLAHCTGDSNYIFKYSDDTKTLQVFLGVKANKVVGI